MIGVGRGLNPGGLWRVLVDPAGAELDSGPLSLAGVGRAGVTDAELCLDTGAVVLLFDGDTGELVARVGIA